MSKSYNQVRLSPHFPLSLSAKTVGVAAAARSETDAERTIEQEIKGDDWNRIEEETPIIQCEECSKRYKIESKYFNPKPAHEYTVYYCVNKTNPEEKIKLEI